MRGSKKKPLQISSVWIFFSKRTHEYCIIVAFACITHTGINWRVCVCVCVCVYECVWVCVCGCVCVCVSRTHWRTSAKPHFWRERWNLKNSENTWYHINEDCLPDTKCFRYCWFSVAWFKFLSFHWQPISGKFRKLFCFVLK